jgi:hypothetical protein
MQKSIPLSFYNKSSPVISNNWVMLIWTSWGEADLGVKPKAPYLQRHHLVRPFES